MTSDGGSPARALENGPPLLRILAFPSASPARRESFIAQPSPMPDVPGLAPGSEP